MSDRSKDKKYPVWHPYSRYGSVAPIHITHARNEFIYTKEGNELIDVISSWWTSVHGHCNSSIAAAVSSQIKKLDHVIFAGFTHDPALKLAELLLNILPVRHEKVFYSDDGSTAVEVAIKIALQYWRITGIQKNKILAFRGSYHGDTFGSMSVSERSAFTEPFRDLLFDPIFIDPPYPGSENKTLDQLETILNDSNEIAAFIYEPLVLGTAGMKMYSGAALNRILKLCKSKGVLCIADEVMTAFGRTGKMFASEFASSKPDLMCLSKGITGGVLPLGVTTVSSKVYDAFRSEDSARTFYHGHSYTGNPIVCAAALKSTGMFYSSKKLFTSIDRISNAHKSFGARIRKEFSKAIVVRQQGTILAIELRSKETGYFFSDRDKIYNHFISKGILIRPLGNVIYLLPPYCISEKSLKKVYAEIAIFLKEITG